MGEKTKKNFKPDHDALNTTQSKTTTTCKGKHINRNNKPLTWEDRKLLCTRPTTAMQTLATKQTPQDATKDTN